MLLTTVAITVVRPGDPPGPDLDRLDCSALITLVRDTTTTTNTTAEPNTTGRVGTVTDILAGHATWRSYYAMLRVYKVYAFAFLPARVVSLSSSPGLLHSKDDFYATPTLVVMETTNGIYDRSLYNPETIKPQTALSWQRAAIATGFGLNGSDWVNLFKRHNSGTYNNQWMVLDTAHFVPGGELPSAGLLYVAEQIPGKVQSADVTDVLAKQGYWFVPNHPPPPPPPPLPLPLLPPSVVESATPQSGSSRPSSQVCFRHFCFFWADCVYNVAIPMTSTHFILQAVVQHSVLQKHLQAVWLPERGGCEGSVSNVRESTPCRNLWKKCDVGQHPGKI